MKNDNSSMTPESVSMDLYPIFRKIFSSMNSRENIHDFRKHPQWKDFIEKARNHNVVFIYICKKEDVPLGWLPVYEYKNNAKKRNFLPKGSVICSFVEVFKELQRGNSRA